MTKEQAHDCECILKRFLPVGHEKTTNADLHPCLGRWGVWVETDGEHGMFLITPSDVGDWMLERGIEIWDELSE